MKHRLDRVAPARVVGADHLFGAGRAARHHFVERVQERGLVETVAVLAGAVLQPEPRDGEDVAPHIAQARAAELRGDALPRHRVPHRLDLRKGPVAGEIRGSVERRLVIEKPDPECRERADAPPRTAIGAAHLQEALQAHVREKRGEVVRPVADRRHAVGHLVVGRARP